MISGDRFEWDPLKSAANEAKHGISFADGIALWNGPHWVFPSVKPGEKRRLIVGPVDGKFWTAVYTQRGERLRIISVRRSRSDEKELFENHLPKS